jgi:AdoMet-dependent heme synthase
MDDYRIINYFVQNNVPTNILLEVTKQCNWKCGFCYADCGITPALSTVQLLELGDELAENGAMEITLTGGEPFIRKDIVKLLKHYKSLGLAINVNTNASLLKNFDIHELSQLIACFNVSLHAVDPLVHNAIVGNCTAWEDTVSALYELKALGANAKVNTVVTNRIADDFVLLKQFVEGELGFQWNPDISISPTYSGDTAGVTEYSLSHDQIKNIGNEILGRKIDSVSDTPSTGICRAGRTFCFIDATGFVYPCLMFKNKECHEYLNGTWLESVKDKSFSEIWRENTLLNQIRNLKQHHFLKCNGCEIKETCFRCIASNVALTGTLNTPGTSHCEYEKLLNN